ncbi:MAG: molybdopterin guanine dinucleotide synthesis [Pseudomonadota bacterium]
MSLFDEIVIVDWSAASKPTPKRPSKDAIWLAHWREGAMKTQYFRTRAAVCELLCRLFEDALAAGRRVMAGFDFPFGYPQGFAAKVAGAPSALALWEHFGEVVADADDNANNRFDVAAEMNRMFPGVGPFWGRPHQWDIADLPTHGRTRHGHGMAERRLVEQSATTAQPCWKLFTTGSVGGQAITGIARLQAMRSRFGAGLAVWPFEPWGEAGVVLTEIYPSAHADAVSLALKEGDILDEVQVRVLAEMFAAMDGDGRLGAALDAVPEGVARREEGWILGLG